MKVMRFEVPSSLMLFTWGFAVFTGWLTSYYLFDMIRPLYMVGVWTALLSLPTIFSFKWMSQNSNGSYPVTWIATSTLAVLLGLTVVYDFITLPDPQTLSMFLFFAPAVVFAINSYAFEGIVSHLYVSASLANFVIATIILFQPVLTSKYFILAGATQGLPLMYHAYIEA